MSHRCPHSDNPYAAPCPGDDDSPWATVAGGLACAFIILAIGGCQWLQKQDGPLVIVRHEAAAKP